jgi:hypothetical protein
MEKLQQELKSMTLDTSNPYMQCLANLLEPPTKTYLKRLLNYYERMLPTLTGKKRDVVEKLISQLKKKII